MLGFIGLCAIIAVGAATVAFGGWLLVRRTPGTGNGTVEWKDWIKIDAPAGVLVLVAGLAVMGFTFKFYSPQLQAEIDSLTKDKKGLQNDIETLRTTHDQDLAHIKTAESATEAAKRETERARDELADANIDLREEARKRNIAESGFRETMLAQGQTSLSDDEVKQLNKVQAGVDTINSDLTYFQIVRTPFPTLAQQKTLAVYELYRKGWESDRLQARGAGAFWFVKEQFHLNGNASGELDKIMSPEYLATICETAFAAANGSVRLKSAIGQLAEQLPRLVGFDRPENSAQEHAEILFAIARLKILSANLAVWVRGFADGEQGPWRDPLAPYPYKVQVHANADPDPSRSESLMTFEPMPQSKQLGAETAHTATYGNLDLPDLRASEIAGITSKLVAGCPRLNGDRGPPAVEILAGTVYPQLNVGDRRVRIYIAALPRP